MDHGTRGAQHGERVLRETMGLRDVALGVQDDADRASVPEIRVVPGQTSQVRQIATVRLPATQLIHAGPARIRQTASSSPPSTSKRPNSVAGMGGFWRRVFDPAA
jgi:hypothetical protein